MGYKYPPISLLNEMNKRDDFSRERLKQMAEAIVGVMELFGLYVHVTNIRKTLISVCFDIIPEPGSSIKNVKKLKNDLELRLGASIEIVVTYNEDVAISIAVLPQKRPLIGLRSIIESDEFQRATSPLTVATGISYSGNIVLADIEDLPHMLIAGTTGSGKTVFLDDVLISLLYKASPEDVRLFLVDPKRIDLSFYSGLPHLLAPVIYEKNEIIGMFGWIEDEMMKRFNKLSTVGCKNINAYYEKTGEKLPQILIIIDEYAELMRDHKKDVEDIIERLSRLGRAAGVHLIIATQRPTMDIVTGSIKANLPSRVSFTVVDSIESNAIINKAGAQRLLGSGDMLFTMNSRTGTMHEQAPFVSEKEIMEVVEYVISHNPSNMYEWK